MQFYKRLGPSALCGLQARSLVQNTAHRWGRTNSFLVRETIHQQCCQQKVKSPLVVEDEEEAN